MKDKIIEKQKELIHQMGLYSMELDMPEILSEERLDKINKISMGIKHLASELAALKVLEGEEVSDEEIRDKGFIQAKGIKGKVNRASFYDGYICGMKEYRELNKNK